MAKAGAGALTEALVRRATELRAERQRLLHDQERARQELALCEATVLEESKIRQNLARLGQALTNLAPEERKELVQLFVERVEVRRHASGVRSSAIDTGDRTMDVRIKLHLQELIRGLQERASGRIEPKVSIRGLNVVGSVDFSHAQRGEVAIVTPFRRTLRLDDRVRTATSPKSAPEVEVEHPILRAQLWQRKLAHGEVASRLALAQRVGVDPAMVTRIMKLLNLAPEIQEFLAQQKTPSALWYFNIKTLGAIADLAFDKQRIEFGRIAARYEKRRQALHASSKTVPIVPMATTTWKHGPKFAAG